MSTLLERPFAPVVPEVAPRRRERPPADTILVGCLLAVVVLVQGWNITNYPAIGDDEGTYLSQAWAVQQRLGLAHYTYWYDHPPLGWIQLALLSWVPANLFAGAKLAVAHGRLIMPLATAASAWLVFLLARRLSLSRWAAALAVLLFGLSPLSVTLHRQIYLDNVAVPWMLAAFALALSPRRHLWHHVAAGVCAAASILSKETMAIVLPALVVALWQGCHHSTRRFSLAGFSSGLVLTGAFYPLYALLKGELLPGPEHVSLLGALLFQLHGRSGSGSVFVPGSGANQMLQSWLYFDAVLVVGGAVAVAVGLASRRARALSLAGVLLVLVALRPNGYLPGMYVIQALPFFALALAWAADAVAPRLLGGRSGGPAGGRRRAAAAVVVALAAVLVVPRWYEGDRRAVATSANGSYAAAVAWVRDNVPDPGRARIVVDDAVWLDMVRAGFSPGLGAIWFYKLDLDPAVARALPRGWREIDYVVSSPAIRQDPNHLPTVEALLANSRVLAVFGAGQDRVEIRQVIKGTP